jgi:transposase
MDYVVGLDWVCAPPSPDRRPLPRIRHAVAEAPDGRIVMSFPRAGQICAATILAELGDDRAR